MIYRIVRLMLAPQDIVLITYVGDIRVTLDQREYRPRLDTNEVLYDIVCSEQETYKTPKLHAEVYHASQSQRLCIDIA